MPSAGIATDCNPAEGIATGGKDRSPSQLSHCLGDARALGPRVLRPWPLGADLRGGPVDVRLGWTGLDWIGGVRRISAARVSRALVIRPLDRGKTATRWWIGNKVPLRI